MKVGLFGVEQTSHKKSPYYNPEDPKRTIFRYAPGLAILESPFVLRSKMTAPYKFDGISMSIFAWYAAEILALIFSAIFLIKLIDSPSREISMRNLRISFLMALPLIGYELANSQNKLIALFFMLAALLLFTKKKLFFSAVLFSVALTIYVPLFFFIIYFVLRSRGRFIISFIAAAFIVFFVIPSLFWGAGFNIFLLKEWYTHSIKPFLVTNSYITYIDLRNSSQSLPSAIGRIFVTGKTGYFSYLVSPQAIHLIIKILSAVIILFSSWAILKRKNAISQGLEYAVFFMLALMLPQYCIYYTWSWMFVIYFAIFNYLSYRQVPRLRKTILRISTYLLFFSTCLIGFHAANYLSNFFWATLFLWSVIILILIFEQDESSKLGASFQKNHPTL